jgi:mannose-1-phosphate guanylyltransferase / mannose-6-phosphate isomerase
LSLQLHFHRSEHWVVVRDLAEVTIGDDVKLPARERVRLCADRAVDRLVNLSKIPLS